MFTLQSRRRGNLSALLAFAVCVLGALPLHGQSHENWSGWFTLDGHSVSSAPAVARDSSGRLAVFVRSSAGQLIHSRQVSAGSEAWTTWQPLETGHAGNPVAIADNSGLLWVFVRGADNRLYHKRQVDGGAWSAWQVFDGALFGDPAVVLFQGRLHVFVRGTDDGIYFKAQNPDSSWSNWVSLGGKTPSNPAVVARSDTRLDVFVRGKDNPALHYKYYDLGAWSASWANLGGTVTTDPAVATYAGTVEVIARHSDGRLRRTQPGSGFWIDLGGPVTTSDPVIGVNHDGRMEIFVRGSDGTIYHNYQETPGGSFGTWTSFGGGLAAAETDIAVGRNLDGTLQIFIRAADSLLDHNRQLVPGG